MGRAIDMEKRLDDIEIDVKKLYSILDELSKVNPTQKKVDLHEKTKKTTKKKELVEEEA